MTNIKPISDLRNYTEVLKEVSIGNPVYLTRNGRGEFAIMKIQEYDELRALKELYKALEKGETSAKETGWISAAQVEAELGVQR